MQLHRSRRRAWPTPEPPRRCRAQLLILLAGSPDRARPATVAPAPDPSGDPGCHTVSSMSETVGAAAPALPRPARARARPQPDEPARRGRGARRVAGHGAARPAHDRGPAPGVPLVPPPRVRRRHLRRVGARHAPRPLALPQRVLGAGTVALPVALRRRPAGPAHDRRARVTPMLAGILATIGSWAIACRLAGPRAGLIAGVLSRLRDR